VVGHRCFWCFCTVYQNSIHRSEAPTNELAYSESGAELFTESYHLQESRVVEKCYGIAPGDGYSLMAGDCAAAAVLKLPTMLEVVNVVLNPVIAVPDYCDI
jgi:hypothetical protein